MCPRSAAIFLLALRAHAALVDDQRRDTVDLRVEPDVDARAAGVGRRREHDLGPDVDVPAVAGVLEVDQARLWLVVKVQVVAVARGRDQRDVRVHTVLVGDLDASDVGHDRGPLAVVADRREHVRGVAVDHDVADGQRGIGVLPDRHTARCRTGR